ncbi:TPA: hypothetical protein G8M64_004943 [Salmonella enterica]|nr:hypothetical protein [Salmonella enterica]HAF1610574.1 hypothetical protein [Salmonella enterica]
MKGEELERLYSVSAQLKKGIGYISTGRVEPGRVWIEEAARSLNILLRIAEAEIGKAQSGNE